MTAMTTEQNAVEVHFPNDDHRPINAVLEEQIHSPKESDDDLGVSVLDAYLTSQVFKSLPPRHTASLLLNRFFETSLAIWPFLSEEKCRTSFEQAWTSYNASNPTQLAQLNLIFCLTSQFSGNNLNDDAARYGVRQASDDMYHRAQSLISARALNDSSIPVLQSLLLMIQYQQATMRSSQSYLTTGHATRMAQDIGLHIDISSDSYLPALDRQLRRRLWWSCFCLDR